MNPGRPPVLVVVHPSGERSRSPLDPVPFLIGRQAGNHLVLRDSRASRNHARIVQESGRFLIEDLKSSHGIFVNGARVRRHALESGDRIEFGFSESYTLIFTDEEDALQKLLDRVSSTQHADSGLGKLRSLVEVARALQNSLSLPEVLAAVVNSALAITGMERGFLLQKTGERLEVTLGRDKTGATLEQAHLDTPVEAIARALSQRRELLSMRFDPLADELRTDGTITGRALRSVICVPLVRVRPAATQETVLLTNVAGTIGALYLDSAAGKADLSSGNRELLQTLALEASTILENARLLEYERARQRIEEELRIAREIQQSLLPKSLPSEGWFRAAGSSVPTHQVGGDCFDVRQTSGDSWSVAVFDVSGKGVSSALLAALLQGALFSASDDRSRTGSTLERINGFLHQQTEGEKYATVFYCLLARDGALSYANAGHCEPIVVRADRSLELLASTGSPLGLLPDASIGVAETRLLPGDKVVIFSDGLTEACDVEGRFFGAKQLRRILRDHAGASSAVLHDALVGAVARFAAGAAQADDMTAVVFEYRP